MGGRRSVWPDNVKVFKGGNEKVNADVWGASPRSWSVHSNPCPAEPRRLKDNDHGAVTVFRPMGDLHTPSVPKRADVSLCQPTWSEAVAETAQSCRRSDCLHEMGWDLNYKQRGGADFLLSCKHMRNIRLLGTGLPVL